MQPITDLLNCSTIAEVKQVHRKYSDLPSNQKWRFDNLCERTMIRITRVNDEKKKLYSNLLN
jgi:hypothetical protein